ncbi:hypothetical protein K0504_07610 [Neiella marina]|uniref:Uncharacterized protein n=1 Tax=Neiella holothuriorum TaxID=2870530 RepID=A0ABS7EEY3_9GAMM|nr:hypothetical protein [Neiella holothuriorum]MBW8190899.1 hypothetical protein [Neiella holothuriorum]
MRLLSSTFIALPLLFLFGCGGGSSSSSGTETSPPSTEPTIYTLTVQGIAADSILSDADVTLFIDNDKFVTTTISDGSFSLEIEYEEGDYDGDEFMTLHVEGSGSQSHIERYSHLGTLATLNSLAGSDDLLQQEQLSRLAPTNVTTALYLLSLESGVTITDDDSLAAAEASINAQTLANIASFIKVLSDNIDYIPSNKTAVDKLSGNDGVQSAMAEYLADIDELDSDGQITENFADAMNQALADTISSSYVIQPITEAEAVGTHVSTLPVTEGWVAKSQGSDVFTLNSDGSGSINVQYYEDDAIDSAATNQLVQWSISENGVLALNSYSDVISTAVEYHDTLSIGYYWGSDVVNQLFNDNFEGGNFNVTTQYADPQIIKLADGKVVIHYSVEKILDPTSYDADWEGEYPTYDESYMEVRTWHQGIEPAELWASEPIGSWVLPTVSEYKDWKATESASFLVPQVVELSDNYSVLDSDGSSIGKWSYDNGSVLLELKSDWDITIQPFAQADGLFSAVLTVTKNDYQLSQVQWIAENLPGSASLADDLVQELPMTLAVWTETWLASTTDDAESFFESISGYELTEGGTVSQIAGYSDYSVESGTEEAIYLKTSPRMANWQALDDNSWLLFGDTDFSDELNLSQERSWQQVATRSDGSHIVLEHGYYQYSGDDADQYQSGYYILPRLNVVSPYDLSTYEEEYQYSIEQGYLW